MSVNAETGSGFDLTDQEMRKAVLRRVVEVECKECQVILGYEANRGEAWLVFAQHVAVAHNDGLGADGTMEP